MLNISGWTESFGELTLTWTTFFEQTSLVPILQDWLQYGEGETLSSFSYQAKLQLRNVTISDTAVKLELHDSCSSILATLHEDYREDVRFLGQHSILTLDTTTSGPRELVIVSSTCVQNFVSILSLLS